MSDIKILHIADVHLGRKYNQLSESKAELRRSEVLVTFENTIGRFSDAKIVLISGDLFDADCSENTVSFVNSVFKKYSDRTFFVSLGNHDYLGSPAIQKLKKDLPENVIVFDDTMQTFDVSDDLCVSGISFASNSSYVSLLRNFEAKKGKINIVVMHGDAQNTSQYNPITIDEIKNCGAHYLALGHIHSMDKGELDERGVYAQCGCLDGRGFDECGIKGFMLIDTEEKSVEFIEASSRIIYEKEVDISDVSSTYGAIEKIKEALIDISENSVVRVNLIGKIDSVILLNEELILSSFKDEYFAFSIKNKTKILMDYKTYENDVSLKGEFIRICQRSDMPEEKRVKVITTVLNALEAEELGV